MLASETSPATYRADIDGLRAIAIIAVILFHINQSWIPGGFAGVDIFFVISGYLISSHIFSELDANTFSLARFYERRIRRIFPALAVVMGVVTIASLCLFLPTELIAFGKSLAAASLSGSNILFWRESGYFQLDSQLKPLLHTWSLAVEEQFYILFPCFLLILRRILPRYVAPMIVLAWTTSFALIVWATTHGQETAGFFLLPTRAWELLTGSCLALGLVRLPETRMASNSLALAGIAAIIGSCFVMTPQMAHLGAWLIIPVLGAAALIHSASKTSFVNRVLTTRMFVFLGLISYSLYLWHWPVFVFTRYVLIEEPGMIAISLMLAVTLLISVLSWKFIEKPFRNKNRTYNRTKVFGSFLLINLAFLLIGVAIFKANGLPNRFPEKVISLAATPKGVVGSYEPFFGGERIVLGEQNDLPPKILLWGDSHANSVSPAVDQIAKKHHASVLMLKEAGCMPYTDVTIEQALFCKNFTPAVVKTLAEHPEIKTVILVGRWSAYPRWWSNTTSPTGNAETREKFSRTFLSTVESLSKDGRKVIIVAEPPRVAYSVPSVLARMELYGREFDIRPSRSEYLTSQAFNFDLFEKAHKDYGAVIIYPHETFCGSDLCDVIHEGQSLYFDGNHLSVAGADYIAKHFESVFKPAKK